ncbi:MAG: maleylacetoacetate isomerase [Persicimonas sp.]
MKLYSYWRSSSSWRVRMALAFKGVDYDYEPIHLLEQGGVQHSDEHRRRNAMEQVPVLEVDIDGTTRHLAQSMAILEFIEEAFPEPALLPEDPFLRARSRQLAETVNSGIQPLQNLLLLQRLGSSFDVNAKQWCAPFIADGLRAYEALAEEVAGEFSVGDQPTFADLCLIPQMYNARRFEVDMSDMELLLRIEQNVQAMAVFDQAHPDQQPDAAG